METTLFTKLDSLADDTLPLVFERNKLRKLKLDADTYQKKIDEHLQELQQGITTLSEQQSTQEQNGIKDTQIGEDQLIQLQTKVDKLIALDYGKTWIGSDIARFTTVDMPEEDGEILQLQQRIMEDQDQNLDQLTEAIRRQQELGNLIGEELEAHAQLLDETEDMENRSDERVRQVKRKLHQVNQRIKDNKSICIILALLLLLFILVGLFR